MNTDEPDEYDSLTREWSREFCNNVMSLCKLMRFLIQKQYFLGNYQRVSHMLVHQLRELSSAL